MSIEDSRGIVHSTSSEASLARYERALELLQSFTDPLSVIDEALAEEPGFVGAHCLRASLGVLALESGGAPLIRESVREGRRLDVGANDRERRHLSAALAWADGDFHHAIDLYGRIALDYPRDALALLVAHIGDFALGQQRELRDRVAQALPHWREDEPGGGHLLGMLAFGMEETNLYREAVEVGQRAVDLNPRDPWAIHAIAHVLEMNGRVDEGMRLLESRADDWAAEGSMLACHLHWHYALFAIEAGDTEAALHRFDRHIWPAPTTAALELVDASALLWRLHLRGEAVRARAEAVSEAWLDLRDRGFYAFNDVHQAMAYLAAGRVDLIPELRDALAWRLADGGSNARLLREIGIPVVDALFAFAEERYDAAVDALLTVRPRLHHLGGSNAQRDVFDQTLAEAAVRAGRENVARGLAAERRLLRPESSWARAIDSRARERSSPVRGTFA